ncbi:MAG: hypothetical protein ACE5GX_15290 [Thermoanaerobaculia bacterium]
MRRIFLLCVLAQILLGSLATKTYLSQHNSLHANGRWISSKTRLERALMGSFAFVTERQSLAGGTLNLGAWHGFQEVVYSEQIEHLASLAFDFRVAEGSDIVALFDRDPAGTATGALAPLPGTPARFCPSVRTASSSPNGP